MRKFKNAQKYRQWISHKNKTAKTPDDWNEIDDKQERNHRKFIIKQLINSMGCKCYICKKDIDNRKDVGLYYITPTWRGGQTAFDNCRLIHKKCAKNN